MEAMKTLFSRILLAQVIAVLLALVVVTVITRVHLGRSFKGFLETREPQVLQTLVPIFEELYQQRGWRFLRDNPRDWQRIWRSSRPPPGRPPPGGPGPGRGGPNQGGPPEIAGDERQILRWMQPQERRMFRNRLFLLDENRSWVGGAQIVDIRDDALEAIEIDGQVVGWIGFAPMGQVLPPEAERFLGGQVRIMAISFVIALLGAAALSFFLARRVSKPVRQLGDTVRKLTGGHYHSRAPVNSHDEIGILTGQVNQLAETLEKNRSARQRWMADIAHELRTPLAILKGEVEAQADGVRQPDERLFTSLREEVDQLSTLVDDLQTLAMSDAGALNIEKGTLDLTDLVTLCIESYRDRLAARGIGIDLQADEAVTLVADQRRLRQLFSNLLENSTRYVEQDGRVRVSVRLSRNAVDLTFEDSGPGLKSEQIQRLFERFYRVDISRSRLGGGSGLGLSICKNIVEAHGGSIRAEPSDMGGLKIHVSLPS
jgi:two-component system sensor histidine kinase BaeS